MKHVLERLVSGTTTDDELVIILDALPIALSWCTLPEGRIKFVNRAFTRIFGYQNGRFETVDQWIDETYVDEADRVDARERWQRLWSEGRSGVTEVEAFEVKVKHASGELIPTMHRGIIMHQFGLAIATFEDLSDRKMAENALRRIAYEDALTGLGNRRMLEERWNAEMELRETSPQSTAIALLMIDLDDFKPINDYYGHAAGDEILKKVAKRLGQSVRYKDTIVRMGGDEFVILLTDLVDQASAEKICQRISEAFVEPFAIQGETVNVGATVGASLYPEHGSDLGKLLHAADQALYRMKRNHVGRWAWFDRSFESANGSMLLAVTG